ncbi:MAG TPA: hypothetical protein DCQ64_07420 [Candidatus Rokubacteria bacterium]|nr:hypothetical protein [Candidatus Rokubacteria bacterium]
MCRREASSSSSMNSTATRTSSMRGSSTIAMRVTMSWFHATKWAPAASAARAARPSSHRRQAARGAGEAGVRKPRAVANATWTGSWIIRSNMPCLAV